MISALVLTQNSEKTLERTLKSLKDFDEILVVDGGSQDSSLDICQKYNVKVISNKFEGFSLQRNFALEQASFDWCLFVDSDEAVSLNLYQELKKRALTLEKLIYRVIRVEYINGSEIKTGFGATGYQERFMNRKFVRYEGKVHETPYIQGKKKEDYIENIPREFCLYHNPQVSMADFLRKVGPYSILKVEGSQKVKKVRFWFTPWLYFNYIFFKILWKSRKVGPLGVMAAFMEAYHRSMVYLLLYEKEVIKTK